MPHWLTYPLPHLFTQSVICFCCKLLHTLTYLLAYLLIHSSRCSLMLLRKALLLSQRLVKMAISSAVCLDPNQTGEGAWATLTVPCHPFNSSAVLAPCLRRSLMTSYSFISLATSRQVFPLSVFAFTSAPLEISS